MEDAGATRYARGARLARKAGRVRRTTVRGSRFSELRTQNFELRVPPVTPVSLDSAIGNCSRSVHGRRCGHCDPTVVLSDLLELDMLVDHDIKVRD